VVRISLPSHTGAPEARSDLTGIRRTTLLFSIKRFRFSGQI
jgi:hypothetical protein